MALKTTRFDAADFLDDPETAIAYLNAALETGDSAAIADAVGVVARAKGMTQISRDTGLSRESLYKALSENGNPEFSTILRVMSALGLQLNAAPRTGQHA